MTNKKQSLQVFTDGGARGNPGPAAAAFVVFDQKKRLLFKKSVLIGETTNNFAEYQAVLIALGWLSQSIEIKQVDKAEFFIDSMLVVNQLNGLFKIKNIFLKKLAVSIKKIEQNLPIVIKYRYISRASNKIADRLVNSALDKEKKFRI